jgi:hypothetical protein
VTAFNVGMGGAAERPEVTTSASALGILSLKREHAGLPDVTYTGLSAPGTDAHIHAPVAANGSGPVLIPFTVPTGTESTLSGTAPLTPVQLATFVEAASTGGAYANVHSSANKGGETKVVKFAEP